MTGGLPDRRAAYRWWAMVFLIVSSTLSFLGIIFLAVGPSTSFWWRCLGGAVVTAVAAAALLWRGLRRTSW